MDERIQTSSERRRRRATENGETATVSILETLPSTILINEILLKLELDTLCSVSCASRAIRFSASQALALLSSLNLSEFSPDGETIERIAFRCRGVESVALNCLRLQDSSVSVLLGPNIRELNFLSCSVLSYRILASIGKYCPNLRVLMLEFADCKSPEEFKNNLTRMLDGCFHLESLCLKIRGTEVDAKAFQPIQFFLPKTLKSLKLQPVLKQDVIHFINENRVDRSFLETRFSSPFPPSSSAFTLQCLSLVLDVISDELIISITNSLPFLVELELEDRPNVKPWLQHDLTNTGLQSLAACCHLISLSLIRNRHNYAAASFRRINDMGLFLLSESCKGLESVRLCGFTRVTDAGFASILHSCPNLKKFEIRNALLLSDLAFHDLTLAPCSLVVVRLMSCSLITCETVRRLACSRNLEVLDLFGCRSIADSCLQSASVLSKLTTLNLTGSDVTDDGLSILGHGSPPITRLSLRACKRVTDKGVSHLLHSGAISKTLSTLDLANLPGISDKGIVTIAVSGIGITELCIRNCFHVTDFAVEALATMRRSQDGSKLLRRLDLCYCTGLSVRSLGWLKRPWFCGLHWLGVADTQLTSKGNNVFIEICEQRPWLTVCLDGCEMGCLDGWQYHRPEYHCS